MKEFPYFEFSGSSHDIGRQHGRLAGTLVRKHLDMAVEKLRAKGIALSQAKQKARLYKPFVEQYMPQFAEELVGLAEGAELPLEDAYILQLRSELGEETTNECTTFAVSGRLTADGEPLAGQNADLPANTCNVGIVIKVRPNDGRPAILMLTPAGQISYMGINDRGLAVFANFLNTDGWRTGLPRYMLSRLVLEQPGINQAVTRLAKIRRASPRNLLIADAFGQALDLELAVDRMSRVEPDNGLLTHANHFIAKDLLNEERQDKDSLANSRARQARLKQLLESEPENGITMEYIKSCLRDRTNAPDCLCRHPGDDPIDQVITWASLVARPSKGELYIAAGPPDQTEYTLYTLEQSK
jgi:predicted choloylglycine hydrolase